MVRRMKYNKKRIMDPEIPEFEPRRSGSSGQASCSSFSRRLSLSSLYARQSHVDDDIESEIVSEAGDIGDRALHSNRCSESCNTRFSFDNVAEDGILDPIQKDTLLHPSGFWSRDPNTLNTSSPVSPSILEIISPLSVEAFISSGDKKKVLARYCLQKLFGPQVVGATSDQSYMYPDLPSNMVGSFFMGWFGVVFKGDISKFSEQLAIGLTTGFLGSLTTFSGWNQKMLDLCVKGQWVFAGLGILLGLLLVAGSIVFGIETAKGLIWLQRFANIRSFFGIPTCFSKRSQCLWTFTVMLLLMLGLLWGVFGGLETKEFKTGSSKAQLFLACIVGPFGVWIRWLLARFNGRGLGKNGSLKWIPFGTLAANILAACIMAALATLKKAVQTKTCNTVATGVQFGLLGCLSTVSTFIAEFHAMRQSKHPWRSYAYATITFLASFVLGTLIYSVPVWANGYD